MPGTRKLGRPTAHRVAMLRGMVTLLLENGQIETTLARAKEVRSMAEKMITLGKKNTLASRRAALAYITKESVVTKLFTEIAPSYADRNGGYTRILKLGNRRGDAAEMAIVALVKDEKAVETAPATTATEAPKAEATEAAPAEKAPAKKPAAKKATTAKKADGESAAKKPAAKKTTTAKKAAAADGEAAPAKKPAAKKTTAKKATAADGEAAPAKKPAAKKTTKKAEETPAE
ncbi:MAG TPA: 50S ribosomal protein L17 [Clostridiales bacterium]|nr:50S ribosomal protein L17 [Clostridiales bacterium]